MAIRNELLRVGDVAVEALISRISFSSFGSVGLSFCHSASFPSMLADYHSFRFRGGLQNLEFKVPTPRDYLTTDASCRLFCPTGICTS